MRMAEWQKNLAVMWVVQFAAMGAITGVTSFLPLYVPELGVASTQQAELWGGVLMGITPGFAALFGPYWGRLADRHGRKIMVERVMLAFALFMILMGFVHNVYELLGLRIVQGIFGGFTAAALALVTSITPPEEIGFSMGVFQTAMIAGGAFGPMFGGFIADHISFRAAFISFGLLCAAAFVCVFTLINEHFTPVRKKQTPSLLKEARNLFAIPGLWTVLIVQFLVQFGIQVVAPILPLYIQNISPAENNVATITGVIIAIAGLTSAVASAAMGYVSKALTFRQILFYSSAGSAVLFAAQAFTTSYWTLGTLRGLSGFFLGAMLPSINAMLTLLIPAEKRGLAFGFTTTAYQAGLVLGPMAGGVLGLYWGDAAVFLVTGAAYALNALWVFIHVHEPASQPQRG